MSKIPFPILDNKREVAYFEVITDQALKIIKLENKVNRLKRGYKDNDCLMSAMALLNEVDNLKYELKQAIEDKESMASSLIDLHKKNVKLVGVLVEIANTVWCPICGGPDLASEELAKMESDE